MGRDQLGMWSEEFTECSVQCGFQCSVQHTYTAAQVLGFSGSRKNCVALVRVDSDSKLHPKLHPILYLNVPSNKIYFSFKL